MDEGSAVAIAAVIAVVAQSFFLLLESRRSRSVNSKMMTASARLIRDEISGNMEAVHHMLVRGRWWPDELDPAAAISDEDRRLLAANADPETLRRALGSLRRFRQLRRARDLAHRSDTLAPLTRDQVVEATAVFLDLATARRHLSPLTGYGPAPFARSLDFDPEILEDALRACALDTADGLYRPLTAVGAETTR